MKKIGGRVDVYLVDPSSSTSWATFPVASGGGGGVGGEGNGGGAPRLVDAFTFVLFGAEFFGLARAAFGFVATDDTSPVAAAASDCGTTCVHVRRRFTPLVDETVVATSAGVIGVSAVAGVVGGAAEAPATTGDGGGACEVATADGGVDSRLIGADPLQIQADGGMQPEKYFQFWFVYDH
jgi:hypothetical protein